MKTIVESLVLSENEGCIWTVRWPAYVVGLDVSRPVNIQSVHIGHELVASDNPELSGGKVDCLMPRITVWRASRFLRAEAGHYVQVRFRYAISGTIALLLERAPLSAPASPIAETLPVLLPAEATVPVMPRESALVLERAAKRRQQIAECLSTLSRPAEGKRYR